MSTERLAAPGARPIRFVRRGEIVSLSNVPPSRTLLDLLRDDLACTGTKEGCGEGDCGACTVVLGEEDRGAIRYRAVNSCIRLAHSIDGMALFTVEDIAPTLPTACGSLPPEGALRLRPGEAGHGELPCLAMRFLHAGLCHEPVRHVQQPCRQGRAHHPRDGG
jgi:2Fe-2S iron-sulfur cluster binding domain